MNNVQHRLPDRGYRDRRRDSEAARAVVITWLAVFAFIGLVVIWLFLEGG